MFASYWHDMILGTAIFYGLPRVGVLSESIGAKLLSTVAAKSAFAAKFAASPTIRALTFAGTEAGGQSVFFLGISEVSKQVEYLLKRKQNDPLFKRLTLSEAGKDYGRGLYLVLGFKAMQSFHLPASDPENNGKTDEFLDTILANMSSATPL